MDLSIITVNYNTGEHLRTCLRSLLDQTIISYEIIVIDNASTDQSLTCTQNIVDNGKIKWIKNDKNVGFSKANNQAFSLSQGRLIYFINPDAKLLTPKGLSLMIQHMDQHPTVGILGTTLIESGKNIPPKYRYPGEQYIIKPLHSLVGDIAWVIGASLMIRRSIFESLHGFDEQFFLYGEETDLCLRTRQLGFSIAHLESVVVEHIGGASESNTLAFDYYKRKQQALYLFYQKHYHSEDIQRLQRRDRFKAWWRLKTLALKEKLNLKTDDDFDKLQRYRAIADVCKE